MHRELKLARRELVLNLCLTGNGVKSSGSAATVKGFSLEPDTCPLQGTKLLRDQGRCQGYGVARILMSKKCPGTFGFEAVSRKY